MAELREFLYKIQSTRLELLSIGPTTKETHIMSDHFNYLKDLTEKGVALITNSRES
jgi:hypothetical protein